MEKASIIFWLPARYSTPSIVLDALPRYLLKVLHRKIRDLVVFCFLDNRMSKWMLRELFQGGSHLKQSGFRTFGSQTISVTIGFPCVMVPVLSMTTV